MKSLLIFLTAVTLSCSSLADGLGKRIEEVGQKYYSREYLGAKEKNIFPEIKGKIIKNIQFCIIESKKCEYVFPENNQFIRTTRFVSQTYSESNESERVYLYQVYKSDTNSDGLIDEADKSDFYAYYPNQNRLVTLDSEIEAIYDLKDNVNTRSYFILYSKNGVKYLNQYSTKTSETLKSTIK
jgi:hypothetical protein